MGERWGQSAMPGWLIGLSGDLGAGKTQLVKGLAKGLGIAAPITSPTFTLMHEFAGGRLPLWHIDLYRLDEPEEIIAAGIGDFLAGTDCGVIAVEWMDRWFGNATRPTFPRWNGGKLRLAQLRIAAENKRQIRYEDFGD